MSEDRPLSNPPEEPPTLAYAKKPALPFVSRHRGKLILLALLLAVAIPIWRYWEPLKNRVLWQYRFKQAMAHRMPEKAVDLIVDDPARKAATAGNPDYLKRSGRPPSPLEYSPEVYRELARYDPRIRFTSTSGVAFIGERNRPDGTPRLVIIDGSIGFAANVLFGVNVHVLGKPKWTDALTQAVPPLLGRTIASDFTPTRLRSGMADPADPTHITLEFKVGWENLPKRNFPSLKTASATGIIDAHLNNDDSITFTLRSYTEAGSDVNLGRPRYVSWEP